MRVDIEIEIHTSCCISFTLKYHRLQRMRFPTENISDQQNNSRDKKSATRDFFEKLKFPIETKWVQQLIYWFRIFLASPRHRKRNFNKE